MSLTAKQQERCNQLSRLDMAYDGQSYYGKTEINRDFNVHFTEILCDTDVEWSKKILKIKQELRKRKRNISV